MGKRVGVSGGSNDWSRYSYSSSSISRRTGLTREEIRELRQYGREAANESPLKREEDVRGIRNEDIKPKGKPGINLKKGGEQSVRRSSLIKTPLSVEFGPDGIKKVQGNLPGGFGISFGEDGFGASAFGFGVEFGEDKNSVELPGGIKITFVNRGCFVVSVFSILGQVTHTNIEKRPGCDDDDDDDGNGGSGNENDPPHCKGGKSKPINLLPECLRGTGKVVNFYWRLSFAYDNNGRRDNGDTVNAKAEYFWQDVTIDLENRVLKGMRSYKGCIAPNATCTVEHDYKEVTSSLGYTNVQYRGTLEQLEEYLSTQPVRYNGYRFSDSIPGERLRVLEDGGWVGAQTYDYIETKSYAYAHVLTDDPEGSRCNPKGNEGCTPPSVGGNNNRSDSPRTPKPGKGLKSRNKSRDENDMGCCSRMEKKLGLEGFPGELPASLLAKDDGEKVKIENLTQLVLWLIDSLDERLGKFPIELKIEDTDPFKEGKQSQEIEIPNISEMLAEQYGLMFQQSVNSQIQLNIQTNLLIENGLLKQALTRCENILDELVEYLGWEIQTSTRNIDIPFTPEKSNYDEFLQPSKLQVKRIDRKLNEAEKPSLDTALDRLLEAAAIIKQTNFRKINPNIDIASQIANYARLGLDVYNTVKGDQKDDEDWEAFKKKVEDGGYYPSETKPKITDFEG